MIVLSLMSAFAADGAGLAALVALPGKAQALRDHGLDADEVSKLLDVVGRSGLPRSEAVDLVDHSGKLVQQHGPIANFATFVEARLGDGERGAALNKSLTAAHQGQKTPKPGASPASTSTTPKPGHAPHPRGKPVGATTSTKGKPTGAKGKGTTGAKGKGTSGAKGKGTSGAKGKGKGKSPR